MVAAFGKRIRISRAIGNVGRKHPAKEHDLSHQEYPHPQRGRLSLLLYRVKMMCQRRMSFRQP